jgi:thioredoxin 1
LETNHLCGGISRDFSAPPLFPKNFRSFPHPHHDRTHHQPIARRHHCLRRLLGGRPADLSEIQVRGEEPFGIFAHRQEPPLDRGAALDVTTFRAHLLAMALTLTDSNFESEVLKSEQPVLVDFWAEWCGPCKMIGPVIEKVATELEGKAKVGKVNVDDARQLAATYNVRSIPLLLFFKDGEVKDQIVGANVTADQLKAKLEALV